MVVVRKHNRMPLMRLKGAVSPADKLNEVYGSVLANVIDICISSLRRLLINSCSMDEERPGHPGHRKNGVKVRETEKHFSCNTLHQFR